MILVIETMINLSQIEEVKKFVGIAMECDFDVDLSYGKYTVNGKSIMGIFSLDLTKPLKLVANTTDPQFLLLIDEFIVKEQ